jgi:hypothetical protein
MTYARAHSRALMNIITNIYGGHEFIEMLSDYQHIKKESLPGVRFDG